MFALGASFGLLTHCGLLMLRLSLMVIFVHGLSDSSSSSSFSFPSFSSGSSFFTSVFTVTLGGGGWGLDVLPSLCFSWDASGSALTEVSPGAGAGDTFSFMVSVWGSSSIARVGTVQISDKHLLFIYFFKCRWQDMALTFLPHAFVPCHQSKSHHLRPSAVDL